MRSPKAKWLRKGSQLLNPGWALRRPAGGRNAQPGVEISELNTLPLILTFNQILIIFDCKYLIFMRGGGALWSEDIKSDWLAVTPNERKFSHYDLRDLHPP